MKLHDLVELWNKLWFKPQSALPIAVFRIVYGFLVLQFACLLAPDLLTWFSESGMVTARTMMLREENAHFSLLYLLPQTDFWIFAVFALLVLSAATLTLGWHTRASAAIVFLCLISFQHRNIMIFHSGDYFMRMAAYFLLWSQAGKAWSLDCLFQKRDKSTSLLETMKGGSYNPWAQRLLQLQVVIVYFESFISKISGKTWIDGSAVYYALHLQEFQRLPISFLADNFVFCQLLTWYTLFVEFAFFTLIWVKEFRYPVLIAGALLHLGIDWSMNIPQFEYMMIATYMLFIDANDLEKFFAAIGARITKACSCFQLHCTKTDQT